MKNMNIMMLLLGLSGTSLFANTEIIPPAEVEKAIVPLTPAELELAGPAWDRHCAKCHGSDGNGPASRMGERLGLTINYTAPGALDGFTDEQLDKITADGIEGTKMNGFARKLSTEETTALTRYMRSLSIP